MFVCPFSVNGGGTVTNGILVSARDGCGTVTNKIRAHTKWKDVAPLLA